MAGATTRGETAILYDMSTGSLTKVERTTFSDEGILERTHLQAALRKDIGVLGDDLMVVAEEFGDFLGANRRIDLLCLDRACRLVVVELKRTEDGGHMELQAIRYAAMVSVMTFDELVGTFARHRQAVGEAETVDTDTSKASLLTWLGDPEDEPVISREVRVVLASANFSQEVTTTVLWLNEQGLDIRCVRLSPYRFQGRILLDVQPLIPLPEAEALTVKLRNRAAAVREGQAATSSRDLTKYVIHIGDSDSGPLAKRQAILAAVAGLVSEGVEAHDIVEVLGASKMRSVPGKPAPGEIWDMLAAEHDLLEDQQRRWFVETPLHQGDRTWIVSKMWGVQTEAVLRGLVDLSDGRMRFRPEPTD